jgi:hypothetical protein
MSVHGRTLALALWSAAWAAAAAQEARDRPQQTVTGTGLIGGVVLTDEPASQPVRKARVTLNSVDRSSPGRTVTTDDQGRFEFADLADGRFNLAANKPAFLTANYGARRAERPGTPISLAIGQQVSNIVIKIARGGVITGVVRDRNGQPMPGATVSTLRYGYSEMSGERTLSQPSVGGTGVTDDRGVYRAWGLPPGDYVVMVNPNSGRANPILGLEDIRKLSSAEIQSALQLTAPGRTAAGNSSATPPLASQPPAGSTASYAPVFFPAAADLSSATSFTLGLAEERTGVDVIVQLVPTARINGTVTLPEGVLMRSLSITLTPSSSQALMLGSSGRQSANTARIDSDRTFSFGGVTPGQYVVLARTGNTGRGAAPPTAASPAVWWAATDVTIDGRDLNVALKLQTAITVSGRVVLEGSAPPPSLASMRFSLVPPGSGGNLSAGPPGGTVGLDGRFTFSGVIPGTYRLARLGSFNAPWSLKSALADGRDVLDSPLEIKAGGSVKELVVTYTDQSTQISGVLQDATGRPASDYFIIVFPSDRTYWTPGSRRVLETRPANDGRYTIFGLPPGDYQIAALTDVESGDWNDPAFLPSLMNASIRLSLSEGQRKTQDLTLAGGRDGSQRWP